MSTDIEADTNKNIVFVPSSIETMDSALFDYVESLNIFCNTINGWDKIPVIWSSAERSYQIKNNKALRDKNGSLIPPIISIERTSILKDPNKKGNFQSNVSPKDDRYYITKVLNQDKTSNFANADSLKNNKQLNFVTSKRNKKLVYQHIAVPRPIYVFVEYKINILTNYQGQMNEAIQPFMARTAQNYFTIKKDDYRFECFMDPTFSQDSIADLGEEERKFKSSIVIKVLGQLVGEGPNQEKPQLDITENAVEVKLPKEKIIVDSPTRLTRKLKEQQAALSTTVNKQPEPISRNKLQDSINKQTKADIANDGEAQTTEKTKNNNLSASNIETIDGAFYDYVEGLNVFCNTNAGWNKVPVIWASAERSYQIKNNKALRDKNGTLISPIISLERSNITKDPNKKGNFQANVSPKDDRYYITKVLNQDKTSNFANADSLRNNKQLNFVTSKKNEKIVYQHYAMRIPVYITVEYKINIMTNYLMQMNEIVQPFMARTAQSYFVIKKDGHKYEAFMEPEFSQESIVDLGEEERKYKNTITVKVLGYLVGEGENTLDRNINIDENAVEIKFPKEKIIIDGPKKKLKKEISSQGVTEIPSTGFGSAYKKTFYIGNGTDSAYTISHGLNTRDAFVTVREDFNDYNQVIAFITFDTLNTITVDMGEIIGQNSYIVTIIG